MAAARSLSASFLLAWRRLPEDLAQEDGRLLDHRRILALEALLGEDVDFLPGLGVHLAPALREPLHEMDLVRGDLLLHRLFKARKVLLDLVFLRGQERSRDQSEEGKHQ